MSVDTIAGDFRAKVSDMIRIEPEGIDKYRVFTPFMFDDGDHLAIVLQRENGHWLLSDEGHTLMHLTYDLDEKDLRKGTRQKVIANALRAFTVEDRHGVLALPVPDSSYGDALYSYVQAVLRISDVSFLSREQVRSTFLEDFRSFLVETAPEHRRTFEWHDPVHDPDGMYSVDCRLNGMPRPLHIFALQSDDRVQTATISVLQFERWAIPFRAVGIFEDQEEISRRVLARFTDVCDRQFSSLAANKDRIRKFVHETSRSTEE